MTPTVAAFRRHVAIEMDLERASCKTVVKACNARATCCDAIDGREASCKTMMVKALTRSRKACSARGTAGLQTVC